MVVIIDYNVGNLHSVYNAFKRVGIEAKISSDKAEILAADKVVLPGVGAFKDVIDTFTSKGFDEVLNKLMEKNTPILGICVGMQMLFEKSYEYGCHNGLGYLKGEIVRFSGIDNNDNPLKVPHMGWNSLEIVKDSPLFRNVKNGSYVYFVHSFHLSGDENVLAYSSYGERFGCAVQKGNLYGVQFHPEKSGEIGLQILKNFGEL